MKKSMLPVLALVLSVSLFAQKAPKKYPSLLWEITGNGLTKPSYLFGTMHVSSKMVFHLPDSFYIAIGKVDMVALETDPATWQDDLFKYDLGYGDMYPGRMGYGNNENAFGPSDYLNLRSFKFTKYEEDIRPALFFQPSIINSLLYRTQSGMSADFEENTYLDMYIYQTGKKMKKKTGGLEDYRQSMQLMLEAYYDASKEKDRKEKSYDYSDDEYSPGNLQEAYRTGNLDKLDSINRLSSSSDAFDEKFLYRRNEIQANSIDSIIKTKTTSLFSGVGAAHLPGTRGVIELLRKKGYKLRPIMMGERDGKQKDIVDKIRVPVVFNKQVSADSFFTVETPGKLFDLGDEMISGFSQYSDMANGSYYMVSRVKTNAVIWGHSTDDVLKKVDSLLYENVPGKILTKTPIVKNGYKGFDITNRTRRGDLQRYNIFVTPFEVIVFKMSGNNDYVKEGEEAKRFFGSIQLKEYKTEPAGWTKYQPPFGGFAVSVPHAPQFFNTGRDIEFVSEDKSSNTGFYIARKDIHNYGFAEEDTFDLALIEESFGESEFIEKQLSRKQLVWKGYPALDCKYLNKDGSITMARLLIQGPHYYAIVAHSKKETPAMQTFLSSFEIKPLVYAQPFERVDTNLLYKVNTSYYPVSKKIKLKVDYADKEEDDDEDESYSYSLYTKNYKTDVITNDTTGEKIFVSFYKMPEYTYIKDTSDWNKFEGENDSTWIYKTKKNYLTKSGYRVWEQQMTDTNSSRLIWIKLMMKNGVAYRFATETDTLTSPSPFLQNFFATFEPSDTIKGIDPFSKKSGLFFTNYFSGDTAVSKKAMRSISDVDMDSTDFSNIKKALSGLNWSTKKYLGYKESFIGKLGDVKTPAAADMLKDIYYAAGDTIQLQYEALGALLSHKNEYAYKTFRDIIVNDPPVLDASTSNDYSSRINYGLRRSLDYASSYRGYNSDGSFFSNLSDSLKLTRKILPDLLPLLNLEDYESPVKNLLEEMIDSNLVTAKDYEPYFSKFFLETKQELKKQAIAEKTKSIQKATAKKPEEIDEDDYSNGNSDLEQYAKLLLPFADTKPNVKPLLDQMLNSTDVNLQYGIVHLFIKNKKPVPDSILNAVASRDKYRSLLYTTMRYYKVLDKFPAKWNNPIDMAKSKLFGNYDYSKPDTFAYLDKMPVIYKNKNAVVYFFKYREKKDDVSWKIAIAGLMPADGKEYTFYKKDKDGDDVADYAFDITDKTSTKIKEDEPLIDQLQKELKHQLYSKRKSATQFYSERDYRYSNYYDE